MLQGTKGCRIKYKQATTTMDYSFLALQCIQRVPYIVLQWVMEGQIQVISRHMEGQETSDSAPHQGKLQKYLAFFTHHDVRGFKGHIRIYTQEWV